MASSLTVLTVNMSTEWIFTGVDVLAAWSMNRKRPLGAETVPCCSVTYGTDPVPHVPSVPDWIPSP